jgi:Reverse transcriptase (RNA-dependent DNA polymerase)
MKTKNTISSGLHINQPKDYNPNNNKIEVQFPYYRSQAEIDADPMHKVEVQIPYSGHQNYNQPIHLNHIDHAKDQTNAITIDKQSDQNIYTIEDTMLVDHVRSMQKKDPTNYILSSATTKEPSTFDQAIKSDEKDYWYKACLDENQSLIDQQTYDIVDIPPNVKPIRGRWVFKKKTIKDAKTIQNNYITNQDQSIRYKARWVIQGFNQRLGVDFLETFSTTARTETWHMLLIIAVNKGWHIRQYDVKNAFVHADIDTDIYTILPIGLYNQGQYKNKCCKLRKALYGLKQAPRLWNQYFSRSIKRLGFDILPYDEGVYVNKQSGAIIITHVDDIIIIHKDITYITNLAKEARQFIQLEELGQISTFLGNNINIDYKNKTISIDQNDYIKKILDKFNAYERRPRKTPGEAGIRLRKNQTKASDQTVNLYQKEIGSLLYASLKTRIDISYAVAYCSRFMSNPNHSHIAELGKIWQYLLDQPNLGLLYDCSGKDLYIKGYSDADWAGDLDGRKSTTGYIFSLSSDLAKNNPISWNTQLQKSVALSTCEAEYIALKEASREGIYLANIFNYINTNLDLGYTHNKPTILVDNKSAIKLAYNPEYHKRTKHIDIQYHYIRDQIKQNKVVVLYVPTKQNLADILTKNLRTPTYEYLKDLANLIIT